MAWAQLPVGGIAVWSPPKPTHARVFVRTAFDFERVIAKSQRFIVQPRRSTVERLRSSLNANMFC